MAQSTSDFLAFDIKDTFIRCFKELRVSSYLKTDLGIQEVINFKIKILISLFKHFLFTHAYLYRRTYTINNTFNGTVINKKK